MKTLRIFLFGTMRVSIGEPESELKLTKTTQTLLAFLIMQRQRFHSRDVLASLLWGDQPDERARNSLNTALWRLRGLLEPDNGVRGAYLMTNASGCVGFNEQSDYWLDAAIFEVSATRLLTLPVVHWQQDDAQQLECALQLYHGDLLDGFYDDWALRERERMRDLYLRTLAHLMHYYQLHGLLEESIHCGQKMLYHDPLREDVHRELMNLYTTNGQRTLAIRQYELCRQTLASELEIEPMPETQSLYRKISSELSPIVAKEIGIDRRQTLARIQPTAAQVTLQQALDELHIAMTQLAKSQAQLQRATQLVQSLRL